MSLPIASSKLLYSQISTQSAASQPVSIKKKDSVAFNSGLNVVALIVLLSLAFSAIEYKKRYRYKHHHKHHHKHHQSIEQQRKMLERIWQLSSTK